MKTAPRWSPDQLKAAIHSALEAGEAGEAGRSPPTASIEQLVETVSIYQQELEFQNEELERSNAALARARDDLRDLYEGAPVGYATLQRDLKILTHNQMFRRLVSLEPQALTLKPFSTLFTTDSQDALHLHFRSLDRDGRAPACVVRIPRIDGILWLQLESCLAPGSAPPVIRTTLTDISATVRAQEAHWASEQRFHDVVEALRDGILLVDELGQVLVWNHAMEHLTGTPALSALGKVLWDALPPPQIEQQAPREWTRARLSEDLLRLRQDGQPITRPWNWVGPEGLPKTGEFTLSRVRTDRKTLASGMLRDLTEQQALQDSLIQSKKLEAIGLLAGGVAHDFNNLLGAILARVELTKGRSELPPAVIQDLDRIEATAQRAGMITGQLLGYARKQVSLPQYLDLAVGVRDIAQDLQALLPSHVTLVLGLPREPAQVWMDPGQLSQVVTNLVVNAKDALVDRAQGEIRVEVQPRSEGVALIVSDDGPGMSEEVRSRLFEPFFTTKVLGRGTGLGLSTVQGIVAQNRGTIEVHSNPDQGARFVLTFPEAGACADEPRQTPPGCGNRVIVVDDEDAILELMILSLESWGFSVGGYSSAEAALEGVAEGPQPRLLVADVTLPGRSGLDLAQSVWKRWEDTPVLVVSGYSHYDLGSFCQSHPRSAFLAKPFDLQTFRSAVDRLLDPPPLRNNIPGL